MTQFFLLVSSQLNVRSHWLGNPINAHLIPFETQYFRDQFKRSKQNRPQIKKKKWNEVRE